MRLIRQCGLSVELFSKRTKLRQVRFIRRAAYLPENTVPQMAAILLKMKSYLMKLP